MTRGRRWELLLGAVLLVGAHGDTRGAAVSLPAILTLEQALAIAGQHQPQLAEARAATLAARARAEQAFGALLPRLDLTLGYARSTANFAARPGSLPSQLATSGGSSSLDSFDYFSGGLSASQLIWDFGRTLDSWRAAGASGEAQRASERAAVLQVRFDVRAAYLRAQATRALARVAAAALGNQERHRERVAAFVAAETRPAIDLAQADLELATARLHLITAENDDRAAKAELNLRLGVEAPLEYEVTDLTAGSPADEPRTLEQLLEEALAARPELAELAARLAAGGYQVQASAGGFWPSLALASQLSSAGQRLDGQALNASLGLQLSWPLYSGGTTAAQVEEAEAALAALAAQASALRQRIRLELETARLALRAARSSVAAASDMLRHARARLDLAEARYDTGASDALERGDAQLALVDAEAQVVQAHYRLALARAQLDAALGHE